MHLAVTQPPFLRWLRAAVAQGVALVTSQGPAGHLAAAGDLAAAHEGAPPINELYRARRLGLVRLAVLMVDDLETAEDIVQDVFARLYRRHGAGLRTVADPDAYLTSGVMNAARSALRRRRTARAYVLPRARVMPPAEDQALLGEADRELLLALGRLPARQRQVMVLRYWSDLSEQEIADVLRVSTGTVKSSASRALSKLRVLLGENR